MSEARPPTGEARLPTGERLLEESAFVAEDPLLCAPSPHTTSPSQKSQAMRADATGVVGRCCLAADAVAAARARDASKPLGSEREVTSLHSHMDHSQRTIDR